MFAPDFVNRRWLLFCLAVCCVAGATACDRRKPVAPVKIGVIAYMRDGLRETEGLPTLNGATLALSDFRAVGGNTPDSGRTPVELVVEEIGQTQEEAVAATRKLINHDGVLAIVGPQFSADAIPAGHIAELSKVPMLCPVATHPAVTAGRQYVFRMSCLDDVQGAAMARLALEDLSARRAAVLFEESDDYSRGIAGVFRRSFETRGEVVAFESYLSGADDFSRQLERIRQSHPEVLFLPTFHADAVPQAEQARQLGIDAILLGTDGWDQRKVPGNPAFEGAFFSVHWSPLGAKEGANGFARRYAEIFQSEPNGTAALTYDAVRMLLLVLQSQEQPTPESVRDGLLHLPPYVGVAGVTDFVDSGDPQKPVLILQVRDGERHFVKSVENGDR